MVGGGKPIGDDNGVASSGRLNAVDIAGHGALTWHEKGRKQQIFGQACKCR